MRIEHFYPTGSRYITPNGHHNDRDYVALTDDLRAAYDHLQGYGFETCHANQYPVERMVDEDGPDWFAVRRGDLNLMVVNDEVTYLRWLASTELAKRLGLQTRPERVALFEAVREGNYEHIGKLLATGSGAQSAIHQVFTSNVQEEDHVVLRSVGLGD